MKKNLMKAIAIVALIAIVAGLAGCTSATTDRDITSQVTLGENETLKEKTAIGTVKPVVAVLVDASASTTLIWKDLVDTAKAEAEEAKADGKIVTNVLSFAQNGKDTDFCEVLAKTVRCDEIIIVTDGWQDPTDGDPWTKLDDLMLVHQDVRFVCPKPTEHTRDLAEALASHPKTFPASSVTIEYLDGTPAEKIFDSYEESEVSVRYTDSDTRYNLVAVGDDDDDEEVVAAKRPWWSWLLLIVLIPLLGLLLWWLLRRRKEEDDGDKDEPQPEPQQKPEKPQQEPEPNKALNPTPAPTPAPVPVSRLEEPKPEPQPETAPATPTTPATQTTQCCHCCCCCCGMQRNTAAIVAAVAAVAAALAAVAVAVVALVVLL